MSKQNTSSKGFAPWRWLKRMFFGASKEYTLADERYDSPGKLAVKRFFRNPLSGTFGFSFCLECSAIPVVLFAVSYALICVAAQSAVNQPRKN